MALTQDNISNLILRGSHLFSIKLADEFNDSQYDSNIDTRGFNFTLSSDLYYLITALEYRLNRDIIDSTTTCLYLELERRIGTFIDNFTEDPNYLPPGGIIIIPEGGFLYDTFLKLLDTPDSYAGQANKIVTVKSDETGLTFSPLNAVIDANNGLSLSGETVQLGGNPLIKNTTIDTTGYNLFIGNVNTDTSIQIQDQTVDINLIAADTSISGLITDSTSGSATLSLNFQDTSGSTKEIYFDNTAGILINDASSLSGLGYNSDYNIGGINKFGDRWIPDVGYIKDSLLATYAINGLTNYSSTTIGLGGVLDRHTVIDGSGTYVFSVQSLSSTYGGAFSVFNGNVISTSKQGYGAAGDWTSTIDNNGRTITISQTRSRIGSGTKSIVFNGGSGTNLSMVVTDSASLAGLSYAADYSSGNSANPRWIPDKNYIDTQIGSASIYFKANSLLGTGTNIDPFYPNAGNGLTTGDTTEGLILGGTLDRNTTINNSTFSLNFDRAGNNIHLLNFKNSGVTEAQISAGGYFRGGGLTAITGSQDAEILTDTSGILIARTQNDTNIALRVAQLGNTATGDIVEFENYSRSVFAIKSSGAITHNSLSDSITSTVIGHNIIGGLKPSNNGDSLTALIVQPTFGSSTITSWGTLVGGSGYPDGTKNGTVTGGTGILAVGQAIISGGIITSFTLVSGGINYTVGDVLSIVITDSTGTPVGSGGTITVSTITSYTGLTKISAQFNNAPIVLNTISTPATFVDGMIWQDGTHIYARIGGVTKQLD